MKNHCTQGMKDEMTFEEARAELKKISRGCYRALKYELTEEEGRMNRVLCSCYVDPSLSTQGKTWWEALCKMKLTIEEVKK